jgi:hypothetical protein
MSARDGLSAPACKYCERTGQPVEPCCEHHPDQLACSDSRECLAVIRATARELETRELAWLGPEGCSL